MEHAHENDEMRSNTPPDREMLLRTREQSEDKRDHQERRLQLLLQEAKELNARLREQLAGSQNSQPQQTRASIPTALRRGAEPSTRGSYLNKARVPQHEMEPLKRQREQQMSQALPYKRRSPHRTASPNGLSEADSSRTSLHGWTSAQRTEVSTGNIARMMVPPKRQAYINPYPDKERTSSHATKYRTAQDGQTRVHDAHCPAFKHPRQAPQDAIERRLDDMLSTPSDSIS